MLIFKCFPSWTIFYHRLVLCFMLYHNVYSLFLFWSCIGANQSINHPLGSRVDGQIMPSGRDDDVPPSLSCIIPRLAESIEGLQRYEMLYPWLSSEHLHQSTTASSLLRYIDMQHPYKLYWVPCNYGIKLHQMIYEVKINKKCPIMHLA